MMTRANLTAMAGSLEKIKPLDELASIISQLKRDGKKIAFTNGCFDILHVGHVRSLRQAKALADVLVVAVNSDDSTRRVKGEKRPIIPASERCEILAALEFVDYVTVFDDDTPLRTIEQIAPDVLVKGADWPQDEVVGRELVLARGGRVISLPIVEGVSTTGIIERVIAAFGKTERA